MARTLSVPIQFLAEVHEIEGGGYWAEVTRFPGCIAQAETIEALEENLVQAVEDWLSGLPVKTEDEARQLAEIQESSKLSGESFPQPYCYLPPPSWIGWLWWSAATPRESLALAHGPESLGIVPGGPVRLRQTNSPSKSTLPSACSGATLISDE